MWATQGLQTNPSSGDLLADSGQLTAGSKTVGLWLSANVACTVILQHRNSANDSNINSQVFHLSALNPVTIPVATGYINVNDNERLRIVTSGLTVGQVQASLFVS